MDKDECSSTFGDSGNIKCSRAQTKPEPGVIIAMRSEVGLHLWVPVKITELLESAVGGGGEVGC